MIDFCVRPYPEHQRKKIEGLFGYPPTFKLFHSVISAFMSGKTRSAPSLASVASGSGPVFTAMVKHCAATAARTPSGAFSTTMASQG